MTIYRIASRRRWTSVSNDLIEDTSLSFRARGLLVWLLSKPDGWSIRSDAIATQGTEGRDAIRSALRELVNAGYIRRQKVQGEGGRWATESTIFESPETDFQSSVPQSSVSQALTTNDGEAITESPSSLREEDAVPHQVARDYWEWYKIEHNGLRPTIDFLPLRGVVKRLLKSGHEPDAIIDAMKTSKAWTAKALSQEIARREHELSGRVVGPAVPHAVVRAMVKAQPFLDRRIPNDVPRHGLMVRCAELVGRGYGVGETMIRLALAARNAPPDGWGQWTLADVECPRFEGELDDYADAMERAWTNRRWSAK